jgi:hypothetical protein
MLAVIDQGVGDSIHVYSKDREATSPIPVACSEVLYSSWTISSMGLEMR